MRRMSRGAIIAAAVAGVAAAAGGAFAFASARTRPRSPEEVASRFQAPEWWADPVRRACGVAGVRTPALEEVPAAVLTDDWSRPPHAVLVAAWLKDELGLRALVKNVTGNTPDSWSDVERWTVDPFVASWVWYAAAKANAAGPTTPTPTGCADWGVPLVDYGGPG